MKTARVLQSWGRNPKAEQSALDLYWMTDPPPFASISGSVLPYGKGRSYGDVCLNDKGTLLLTECMDHFLGFDPDSGVLRCEAGVTLEEILKLTIPQGWSLPVTPGTKFVTVGGAVANDVHGKNHHRMGTFGEHVRAFELARSDGSLLVCTPAQNQEWFRATIGGMGLTGLMLWVEIQLKRVAGPFITTENIKYENLGEFFDLACESETAFEYTVAWVDCLATGASLGRGIFMRGNDASLEQTKNLIPPKPKRQLDVLFNAPGFMLNRFSMSAFNKAYHAKQFHRCVKRMTCFDPFFYPLDSIQNWNRLYGKRGFFQYQFVVPGENSRPAIAGILKKVSAAGAASFLSVMKTFGDRPAAGMMSFPKKGTTLAMDFPNSGGKILRLMDELDDIVLQNSGAVYPAKDARMAAEKFRKFFSQWKEFSKFVDPRFSSSFWRRVTA
jgi:FAD/FMN-containing dehydrogenase